MLLVVMEKVQIYLLAVAVPELLVLAVQVAVAVTGVLGVVAVVLVFLATPAVVAVRLALQLLAIQILLGTALV
jgi:hypothetical protein